MSVALRTIDAMEDMTEDALTDWLEGEGIRVEYAVTPKGVWGFYSLERELITLRRGMPLHYRVPTLLHEISHYTRGDRGHQAIKVENAINESVALMLINPTDFALAEERHGYHTAGLAHELDLPKWTIRAYRRVLARVVA